MNEHNDNGPLGEFAESYSEAKRDYTRSADPALPFQFQIPLAGGPPGLAVPVGGPGAPFALTVPLGGTTPASYPPVATPVDLPPPAPMAATYDPVTAAQEAAGFGERVLASAEGIVKPGGRPPRSSSAVLESIFGAVSGAESHAEAESMRFDSLGMSFGPLGLGGQRPSATVLFNAFVYPDHPLFPRKALRRHYESRFQPMALPGQPMADVNPRPGDLLLRVARGEDWGHIAVVASPQLCRHDRLAAAGLRGEGYPRLLPGHYVQVVELGPHRRTSADRFARRLSDAAGLVLPDSLLLRPLLPGVFYGHSEAEADPAERQPVLRAGMTGPSVKEAQQKLNRVHTDSIALGLPGLRGCPLPEDGHFSQRMKQAVTDFQQQVFSDPAKWDGTVGADTSAQLNLITGSAPSPSGRTARGHQKPTKRGPIPSPSAPQEPTPPEAFESVDKPTIRRGSQGPTVREAQGKLNAIHARQLAQAAPGLPACPLTEDGIFGDKTREAVVGFQQLTFPSQSSEWDGVVGPKTWFALDQFAGGSMPVSPIPLPVPVPSGPAGNDRIDVCAQFALQRMQRADATAQADGAGMLAAVQSGQLAGIINNTTGAAVQLAQRHGATRFDLVPRGEDAALVLDPTSPLNAPPSIVFRGVETKPGEPTPCPRRERIDPALRKAWATFLLFKSGQLARCDLPDPGASTAFGAAEAFPLCGVVPNLFPQILGQIRGLVTPIRATDVSDYVSLDFVLEVLSRPPFTLTRRAPFRTLADLEAELGPPLTTALIGGAIRRDPADSSKFQTRIRMQLVFPASPGNPTHPAGTGKLPLAVLVHGHHTAYSLATGTLSDKESFRGYRYLQDQLARAGIASISVDTNIANATGSLIELRADMVLQAIKLLKRRASRRGDPLLNRINFDQLALMGHSRGGDAIVRVVKKNTPAAAADRFGIRTACSLAPTDFTGGQVPASRTFLDHNELSFYSVLYGALDGDVSGRDGSNAATGTGFRHYDRARCQKALVFASRCCHNSFNSVWHADGVEGGVTAADRVPGKLVDEATHQQLAKEYICGQFEWHLNGTRARSSLFNGTTPTATGLNTAILWSFGNPIQHVDDFENPAANLAGGARQLNSGAVVADFGSIVIAPSGSINDHVLEQSHVVHADTTSATGSPFGVETTLPAGRRDLSSLTTLALDVGAFFDTTSEASIAAGTPPTFSVILHDSAGALATVAAGLFSPAMGRPFFHMLTSGANVTALRLETLQVSLSNFSGIDLRNVAKIQVEVSPPTGHLFVDHIKLAAF
jgi:peptidoglycan hydrolase-like protein with peptidoglycan-binding domain